jgi:hypothetical protein
MSVLKTLLAYRWPLHLWTAIAMGMLVGCVDTTKPWDNVQAAGTGGQRAGDAQRLDGALPIDSPIDSAWAMARDGAIDVGVESRGRALGGAGGAFDASLSGTGGIVGAGGSILDVALGATGGASGDIDTGGSLVPLGGNGGGPGGTTVTSGLTGGGPGTGGVAGSYGDGGITGTGGVTATGGPTGAGGTGTGGLTGAGGAGTGGVVGTGGTPTPGLLAYYKCDEATGNTLADSSGNGNHGTLYGSHSFAKGKVGNALILVGSGSGYVSLPTKVFAGLHDITIATWMYVSTSRDWQRVFDIGIDMGSASALASGAKYMNLVPKNAGSDLRFSITIDGYNGEESLHTSTPATGVWTHVAIVLDEAQGYGWLYIDGSLKYGDATAIQPDDLGAIDYAWLGRSQFRNDPYFDGMIDEVRVYNRALSDVEISDLAKFTGP